MYFRTVRVLLVVLVVFALGCNGNYNGVNKPKDPLKDTLSFVEGVMKSDLTPRNPEVFQKLLEIKRQLPEPPAISKKTFYEGWKTRGNSRKDMCYQYSTLATLIEACDYDSSTVRNAAVRLAANNPGEYNLGQMCDVFDYALMKWDYVNDPLGLEYVAKASETIDLEFKGDCDDFAVLIGSMLMSIGGDIRINYAYNDTSGHTFVEANLDGRVKSKVLRYLKDRYGLNSLSDVEVRVDPVSKNVWLNMDWFATHPGGQYFPYTNGQRFYPFDRKCESFTYSSDSARYSKYGPWVNDGSWFE